MARVALEQDDRHRVTIDGVVYRSEVQTEEWHCDVCAFWVVSTPYSAGRRTCGLNSIDTSADRPNAAAKICGELLQDLIRKKNKRRWYVLEESDVMARVALEETSTKVAWNGIVYKAVPAIVPKACVGCALISGEQGGYKRDCGFDPMGSDPVAAPLHTRCAEADLAFESIIWKKL